MTAARPALSRSEEAMTDTTPADSRDEEAMTDTTPSEREAFVTAMDDWGLAMETKLDLLTHFDARAALSQQAESVALERWGVIWPRNHAGEPTLAQFADGYWTPWHIANEALQRAAPPAYQQRAEPVAVGHDGKPWPHTIDAKAWADEFCKRNTATDNGTMIAWFANAIEFARAYDAAPPATQQQAEPVAWLDPTWLEDKRETEDSFCREAPHPSCGFIPLYAAPPADDEAVRLLREAWYRIGDRELRIAIDAYLAKVSK
jgi:hypothetical protein